MWVTEGNLWVVSWGGGCTPSPHRWVGPSGRGCRWGWSGFVAFKTILLEKTLNFFKWGGGGMSWEALEGLAERVNTPALVFPGELMGQKEPHWWISGIFCWSAEGEGRKG